MAPSRHSFFFFTIGVFHVYFRSTMHLFMIRNGWQCAATEEVWGRKDQLPTEESKLAETENGERFEKQSQGHTHNFLASRWLFTKKNHPGRTNSEYRILLWRFKVTAWTFVKTSHRNLATKELAWLQRTVLHFFFSLGNFFYQKQHYCRHVPILLFSVFPIEDKTERLHFDTFEVTGTEFQAVINNLIEHDFQDAFKNGWSAGNGAYAP
jgi:hypothetical protein